jgi:hypothetical protein
VTGTVSFFACYSADSTPDCSIGGDLVSADVAVSSLGTASSDAFAPAHGAGTYCFRAEYSPDADAQYSPTAETNAIVNNNDGNNGECFTVAAAGDRPVRPRCAQGVRDAADRRDRRIHSARHGLSTRSRPPAPSGAGSRVRSHA